MCIIAAKPMGVKMPSEDTIENMWFRNPDGAGFMYAYNGKVHIEKGFMKLKDLLSALDTVKKTVDLDKVSMVLHFRIATHGGVIPGNTHPFPVSSSMGALQKLKCTASLGVAHNGIIDIKPRKGVSDTMEYIATQLAPLYKGAPNFYRNQYLMEMVDNAIQSKLALLNTNGEIYTIGNFETCDDILYSNSSYKPFTFTGSYWKDSWNVYGIDSYMYKDSPSSYRFVGNKRIHWLDYDEEYICTDGRGTLIDTYEYDLCVDTDGKLYRYVYEIDAYEEIKGGRAYDDKGDIVCAKEDCSTLEAIYEPVVGEVKKKKFKKKK